MVHFVTIANCRGGVGKSTTAMMLAEGLALFHRHRVLVLDLDPQAMVTTNLVGSAGLNRLADRPATAFDWLLDRSSNRERSTFQFVLSGVSDLRELRAMNGRGRVDLIPMHPICLAKVDLLNRELWNINASRPDQIFADIIHEELNCLDDTYDTIVIDCPSGATTLSIAPTAISNLVIIPTPLEHNSISLLKHYLQSVINKKIDRSVTLHRRIVVLPTLFVRSNAAQQLLLDRVAKSSLAIPTTIPHSASLQRAVRHAGLGFTRSAREKYCAIHTEFKELADWTSMNLSVG